MTHPTPTQKPDASVHVLTDIFTIHLADGLPVIRGDKTIRYKLAKLRETNIADERIAVKLSERVVFIQGQPKLLASDAEFRFAMTMRHVDKLICEGIGELDQNAIDLDVFSKLSPHDVAQIERRIFLIEAASQVRYGLITQEQFDAMCTTLHDVNVAPQPLGSGAVSGASASDAGSGPAMLADFNGKGADSTASGLGQ